MSGGHLPTLKVGELIAKLKQYDVDFIVVGGFAVIAHGTVRATKDLDICPNPAHDNLARLAKALKELKAEPLGLEELDEFELKPDLDGLLQGGSWNFNTQLGRLDVMQFASSADDIGYEHLAAHAMAQEFLGNTVRFCSYEDLIRMKKAAGRDQDLIDIQNLKAARGEL